MVILFILEGEYILIFNSIMYVAIFICLTLSLSLCSIIGATVISIGFYAVMWGKATEEKEDGFGSKESPTIDSLPLLQSYKTEKL